MKQYRFVLDYDLNMTEMVGKIIHLPEYVKYKKGLLQLVEPGCDGDEIQKDLDFLCAHLEGLTIYGMTSHGALSRETHSVKFKVCSLIFMEESDFRLDVFDCSKGMTPSEAGLKYHEVLKKLQNIKGILMMSSDFALCPETFIDQINNYDPSLIVFGALAGTQKMGDDHSKIYVGTTIYERGILAIAFYGENLRLVHYYNLGFKSLGKELVITKSDDKGIVYEINNKPAFNIYKEHLGIGMNDYFFENTSSFPFYIKENGVGLARVALDYHEDGALAFATEIPEGSAVSLGYSTSDIILDESALCSRRLSDFMPEAVLIYVCMSRRMLMGDTLAELEFEFYENVLKSATWAHGYGEILHADGIRGFLNASCVVIGMREGDPAEKNIPSTLAIEKKYLKDFISERKDGYVPLNIRLVNFLESTTDDLREAVEQLFKVASIDELTQIYNRRALNHFMTQFVERKSRYKGVAVMMVDIDHFKHVNDTYGHDVGDIVLKTGVSGVKFMFNQNDIIGRWGGEEFVGIKPNMTKEEALEFCELLRSSVEQMEFEQVGHITVSVGLTMITNDDNDESVFKRIDSALYEAKETGRNKVVFK
ncbi:MAG: GGDEF domain-containing protein [Pseudobutyrivibrio sp.]|nr:GGDEF domain-containing protein [Pseudobutyrivibrio sp.]